MDGTVFTPDSSGATSLHDLEAMIVRTKCAGQVLAIVLDDALAAKHHGIQPQAGSGAGLLRRDGGHRQSAGGAENSPPPRCRADRP